MPGGRLQGRTGFWTPSSGLCSIWSHKAVMGWHKLCLKLEAGGRRNCLFPRQIGVGAGAECHSQPPAWHSSWEGGLASWPQVPKLKQAQVQPSHLCSSGAWLKSGRPVPNVIQQKGRTSGVKWTYNRPIINSQQIPTESHDLYKWKLVPLFSLWICLNMVLYQSFDLSVFWRKTEAKGKTMGNSEYLWRQNQNQAGRY